MRRYLAGARWTPRCSEAWLLLLLTVGFSTGTANCYAAETVRLAPGQDVAAVVANAPAGTEFLFSAGLYRMQSIVAKNNDLFHGDGQVILDGAKVLKMQADGAWWSATVARAKWGPGNCSKDHPRCWILNDLFIDNVIQSPVDEQQKLGAGKWFYDDASGKAYVGTDPDGHLVEFGQTTYAFSGGATGVKISDLIVEKYASPPQRGAIGASGTVESGWTVENVEARWNHGTGIQLGSHAHVRSCKVHHNGQKGIGLSGTDDLLEESELSYNNYAGYDPAWEAGGSKFTNTTNLVVRRNNVHDNLGHALWTDIDNINTTYEQNTITNNRGAGIHHEISYKATIHGNLIRGNKYAMLIANSSDVEVSGNLIDVPAQGDGVKLINSERGSGAYGPHIAHDDHVVHNVITFQSGEGYCGLSGDASTATGDVFDNNEYHMLRGGDHHWLWNNGRSFSDARQMGLEMHSTVSTKPATAPDPTLPAAANR
jgi:parallel beta-helix repeat protein